MLIGAHVCAYKSMDMRMYQSTPLLKAGRASARGWGAELLTSKRLPDVSVPAYFTCTCVDARVAARIARLTARARRRQSSLYSILYT